jgi:hypothetical protein
VHTPGVDMVWIRSAPIRLSWSQCFAIADLGGWERGEAGLALLRHS